ncbi:MAG: nucleoside phosphorylase [Gammaproteobacteria bacterium]|jgi:uridine phosphorylase|nr:nucleoside phosphorylase [Gammaproteobacteria bacterium]MBT4494893.1 nucleoside phosphorylase [Gammaproteobacteria bacterium]MBT7371879.1 nucleoside phosphorylase [Gammaproteobacteria bacterium]
MAFMPILNIEGTEIPERILVVGDPGRLDKVKIFLDDVKEISKNREYHSITGNYDGVHIGAVSHGVGSAGAGACFEEICRAGATRIIRAGSAGGLQQGIGAGDIVIARAAVREDGLSNKLVPAGYPAVATPDIVIAMRDAATSLTIDAHEGLILTSDMFYPHDVLGSDLPLWQRAGVTAVEMEAATLFVVCGLHRVEAGAVLAIDGNPLDQDGGSMETYNPHQTSVDEAITHSIEIALRALIT